MEEYHTKKKRISVLGCGWYGLELAKKLVENGYQVNGSSTKTDKLAVMRQFGITPFAVNFQETEESFEADFFDCDILMISIPPGRSAQHTFLPKIAKISGAAIRHKVSHILFISSTAVYGELNEEVTETTPPHPETASGKVILAAELLLKSQPEYTTTIIRFGGLIGPGRDPGRFFAGKTDIPNGQAPVNLIHLSDCIGISLQIIERAAFGHIYNACAPQHPGRSDFYTYAALNSGLPKPEFRDELLNWKLVSGKNIAQYLDYKFEHNFYPTES